MESPTSVASKCQRWVWHPLRIKISGVVVGRGWWVWPPWAELPTSGRNGVNVPRIPAPGSCLNVHAGDRVRAGGVDSVTGSKNGSETTMWGSAPERSLVERTNVVYRRCTAERRVGVLCAGRRPG